MYNKILVLEIPTIVEISSQFDFIINTKNMHSTLGQKILLSLLGVMAMGLSYTPGQQRRAFRALVNVWKSDYNKKIIKQINNLYYTKLISRKENKDGTITMILTNKGKMRALTYKFNELRIKNGEWDKKWRVIFFDVPEKQRFARDVLRDKIKKLGFYELQKSVFVFPYECENEIEFVIENYSMTKWVRFGTLEKIDNDVYLRKFFKL